MWVYLPSQILVANHSLWPSIPQWVIHMSVTSASYTGIHPPQDSYLGNTPNDWASTVCTVQLNKTRRWCFVFPSCNTFYFGMIKKTSLHPEHFTLQFFSIGYLRYCSLLTLQRSYSKICYIFLFITTSQLLTYYTHEGHWLTSTSTCYTKMWTHTSDGMWLTRTLNSEQSLFHIGYQILNLTLYLVHLRTPGPFLSEMTSRAQD